MKASEKLRRYIVESGYKQTAIAQKIGVKITTFNAILNGHAELKADMLFDVLRCMGRTPHDFFEYNFQENEKISSEKEATA